MSVMTEEKKVKNTYLSLASSLLQNGLVVVLVIVAIMSFGSRVPFLAQNGLSFYAITSGSMEPAVPTGSLVYAGKYKLDQLKKDDIIVFTAPAEQSAKPVIVTHRINEVIKVESNDPGPDGKPQPKVEYTFKTKGDANSVVDGQILPAGNILGKYSWHLPVIGRLTLFAQTMTGFISLIIVPSVVLILWEVISVILHFKQEYQLKSQAEIDKLKAQLSKHENT